MDEGECCRVELRCLAGGNGLGRQARLPALTRIGCGGKLAVELALSVSIDLKFSGDLQVR